MTSTELIWLRSQAAQRNVLHLFAYGTAFVGTAALQAIHLGVTAPRSYWAALSRAAAAPPRIAATATAEILPLIAPPQVDPAPAPVDVSETPAIADALPVAAPSPHLLDAPRGGVADDLTVLKGVGAKLAEALNEFGVYHYDQIAALDEDGIAWLDEQQKGFKMIAARYDLVAQARALI